MKSLNESLKRTKELMMIETSQSLIAPLDGELYVTAPFGQRRSYEVHPGVDLRARERKDIKSPLDGEILVADMNHNSKCGGTIDVKHPDGYWSRFCHVSQMNVKKGDIVKQGQILGKTGGDKNDPGHGNSRARHLHWTLKKNGSQVDPMKHLGASVVSDITAPTTPPSTEVNKETDVVNNNPDLQKILNSKFQGKNILDILSNKPEDLGKNILFQILAMMK